MKQYPFTFIAVFAVLILCIFIDLDLKKWESDEGVIENDIHHYYGYLPAYFIYDDLKVEKNEYKYGENSYMFWTVESKDGARVFRMSMGLAMLYSPFFFAAHQFSLLTGYDANGFSFPYKIALLLSSICFLIAGMYYSARTLIKLKFTDLQIALTLLFLVLATNLLCYSTLTAPMPHVYNYCLFAMFVYYTLNWQPGKSYVTVIILSVLFGLISLTRPNNAIIIVFFLGYLFYSNKTKSDLNFYIKSGIIAAITITLVWLPQLLYWKYVTGHFLFYSYLDNGFNFEDPQIINGLFSFRKGWLIYTPGMLFALTGIFYLKGDLKKFQVPVTLFLIINIYIIFSWWCWWYGGSFGSRPMIESYAILAISLAAFIKEMISKNWFIKLSLTGLGIFLVWLNLFQTLQYKNCAIHWDSMSKELYFKQFGKRYQVADFNNYLDPPPDIK